MEVIFSVLPENQFYENIQEKGIYAKPFSCILFAVFMRFLNVYYYYEDTWKISLKHAMMFNGGNKMKYEYINYTATNPHFGIDKALTEMPFINLVDKGGKVLAQLYLFRFKMLQVSHAASDMSNNAGATWSSVYFTEEEASILKYGDYDAALCVMKLLIEKALYEQSHHRVHLAEDESYEMVYASILQDRETLSTFARMCVDAYRAHN